MDENIRKCCEICAFSIIKKSGAVLCEHTGFTTKDSLCKKFNYDVSKRIPPVPLNAPAFTEDDFSID